MVNVEHHRVRTQLEGICKGIKYLTELMYKVYAEDSEGAQSKQSEEA